MFNFFAKDSPDSDGRYIISGNDCNHIRNVLRMKEGDEFLISFDGKSQLCRLECFNDGFITAISVDGFLSNNELSVNLQLFQGLPKSDKLELIIQKCTELGISEITPVQMSRSVVKLDEKKKKSKTDRWQAIAESAAKQSKRSLVPKVNLPISLNEVIQRVAEFDLFLIPYENENGMKETVSTLRTIRQGMKIGFLIGPEGGFDEKEIDSLKNCGCKALSLGKRILRTETAAIATTTMLMLYCEAAFEEKNND